MKITAISDLHGYLYRKVVFIGGNHDFYLFELGKQVGHRAVMKHMLPGSHRGQSKLVYLCDNAVEIDGVRFYGTPWIADLARWAFYKPADELESIRLRCWMRAAKSRTNHLFFI